jgi:hypothetical protein
MLENSQEHFNNPEIDIDKNHYEISMSTTSKNAEG